MLAVTSGVKVAVIDPTGKVLATDTVYPFQPKNDLRGAQVALAQAIGKHGVKLIAIGNGTASRETEKLVADSQQLGAHDFGARYGLQPSYMADSNAYFERTARVPAAWNRLIFYDGSAFHSAEVDPARLWADPLQGRLTLNSFITCRRTVR